jgi:hypothetical protein
MMQRTIVLFLVVLALAACNRKATREECNQMLDRYVDMTIEPSETTNLSEAQIGAIREMKKAIRKSEPQYSKVMGRCERELSRRTYDCAMKAGNANEWEACVQD